MYRSILLFAVLPLSLSACETMTSEEHAAAVAQRTGETQAAEEAGLRCRTIRQTGSRLGNRVCRTEEEWEDIQNEAQDAHDQLDRGNVRESSPDQGFGG